VWECDEDGNRIGDPDAKTAADEAAENPPPEPGRVYWFAETVASPPRYAEPSQAGRTVGLTADPLNARRFDSRDDALAFTCGTYARAFLPPLRPTDHVFMGPRPAEAEDAMPISEVRAELARRGIDVAPAIARVREALERRKEDKPMSAAERIAELRQALYEATDEAGSPLPWSAEAGSLLSKGDGFIASGHDIAANTDRLAEVLNAVESLLGVAEAAERVIDSAEFGDDSPEYTARWDDLENALSRLGGAK
jgi:hypothetical protein